jgi:hypothetical protein
VASDFGVQFLFAPQEARQWRDPDPDPVAAGKGLMNLIESWGLEKNTLAAVLGAPLLIAEPESMPADSLRLLAQRLTAPVFAMV